MTAKQGRFICEMDPLIYGKYCATIRFLLPWKASIFIERVKDKKGNKKVRLYSRTPTAAKEAVKKALKNAIQLGIRREVSLTKGEGELVGEMSAEEYKTKEGLISKYLPRHVIIDIERRKDKKGREIIKLFSQNPDLAKEAIKKAIKKNK